MEETVEFGPKIRPICLPDDDIQVWSSFTKSKIYFSYLQSFYADTRRDKTVKVAGFGFPVGKHGRDISKDEPLKEVDLKLADNCAFVHGGSVRGNTNGENVKIREWVHFFIKFLFLASTSSGPKILKNPFSRILA